MFACPAPPPYAAPAADRPSYVLDVRVRSDLKVATGDLSVRFTPNRSTDRLVFRLWPNGPVQLNQGSRLSVGRATADGSALRETHPDPTTLVVRASCGAPVPARAGAVSNRPGPLESNDEPNAIEEREFVTLSQEEGR